MIDNFTTSFTRGQTAYREGKSPADNPYESGSDQHTAWHRGYEFEVLVCTGEKTAKAVEKMSADLPKAARAEIRKLLEEREKKSVPDNSGTPPAEHPPATS